MKFFVKCDTLTKPGLGELHFHRRWWRTSGIVIYIPEGRETTGILVPPHKFEEVAHASSMLEAMAILRRE